MEIRYSYRDSPTIKAFADSDKFIRGLMGPFGSGKSSGCVIEIIRRAHLQAPGKDGIRRTRWAVIRNTVAQLSDTTIKTFKDWLPPEHFGKWREDAKEYLITHFPGVEIEVLFRALDRPDDVRKLLSMELTGAWVNEAREVPWSIIEALQGRVGRFPAVKDGGCTWFGIIMDTNPPDDLSHWYRFFEEIRPDNAAIFRQPSGLAPDAENRHNLPANYYENLAAGKSQEFVDAYVKGNYAFVVDGKQVFPEYNDAIHCRDCEPIKGKKIRRGWDFGLTPSCTFSQLLPSGQWVVFDEMVATDMGVDRFSDDVLLHVAQTYSGWEFEDFGDPAGEAKSQTDEKTCFQILRAKGIEIQAGIQTLAMRLEAIRKPLNSMIGGNPGFVLHPRCKMLRRGFMGGYHYRRLKTSGERYVEEPEKNQYSHPMDALQYDATRLFGERLRSSQKKWEPLKYSNKGIV